MRWLIRDGDREGEGVGGGGRKSEGSTAGTDPRKAKEAMEHRQNNVSVKAVSPCHCTATSVLCISCFNCYTEQSYKDHVHSIAVE